MGGAILIVRPLLTADRRLANTALAVTVLISWVPHALTSGGLIDAAGYDGLYSLPLGLEPLALALYVAAQPVSDSESR